MGKQRGSVHGSPCNNASTTVLRRYLYLNETEGDNGYSDIAALMLELASKQPGFLGFETARQETGMERTYDISPNRCPVVFVLILDLLNKSTIRDRSLPDKVWHSGDISHRSKRPRTHSSNRRRDATRRRGWSQGAGTDGTHRSPRKHQALTGGTQSGTLRAAWAHVEKAACETRRRNQ